MVLIKKCNEMECRLLIRYACNSSFLFWNLVFIIYGIMVGRVMHNKTVFSKRRNKFINDPFIEFFAIHVVVIITMIIFRLPLKYLLSAYFDTFTMFAFPSGNLSFYHTVWRLSFLFQRRAKHWCMISQESILHNLPQAL